MNEVIIGTAIFIAYIICVMVYFRKRIPKRKMDWKDLKQWEEEER